MASIPIGGLGLGENVKGAGNSCFHKVHLQTAKLLTVHLSYDITKHLRASKGFSGRNIASAFYKPAVVK